MPLDPATYHVPTAHTRLQQGIQQPKKFTDGTVPYTLTRGTMRYGLLASTGEPRTLAPALDDPFWCHAMQEEHDALLQNKT